MTGFNATKRFLGPEYLWPGLSLELNEIQSLHGGRRVFIYGAGHAVVQIVAPDQQEERYEFRLSRAEVRHLQHLLIQHDLITIKPADRPGRPNEVRSTLSLSNSQGRYEIVSKWAGIPDSRFDAIYAELARLADGARQMKPTYKGRLVYRYKPKQGLAGWLWKFRKMVEDLRTFELRDLGRFLVDVLAELIRQRYLVGLVIVLLVSAYIWVEIDPTVTYGMGGGVVHGFFGVQNSILSLFTGRHIWAPKNVGTWYTIGFVIGMTVIPWLINIGHEVVYEVLVQYLKR